MWPAKVSVSFRDPDSILPFIEHGKTDQNVANSALNKFIDRFVNDPV
jgi:hypothetical protein